MMTHTETRGAFPTTRVRRTVAVVGRHPHQHVLDTVMNAGDLDVVLIDSIAKAYSQIKLLVPHMVIMCVEIDDFEGLQVLSMLTADSATAAIPVVMSLTVSESGRLGKELSDFDEAAVDWRVPARLMN